MSTHTARTSPDIRPNPHTAIHTLGALIEFVACDDGDCYGRIVERIERFASATELRRIEEFARIGACAWCGEIDTEETN